MIRKTDQGDKIREKSEIAREPYVKPQLINYGHVEKLTQSGGSPTIDNVFTGTRRR